MNEREYRNAVLSMRQRYPLEVKETMAKRRIAQFVERYGLEGTYVSFSGGKDSLVVLDMARKMYPDIKAVFCDTWLEYPSLREYVNTFSNVDVLKPVLTMKEIVHEYGWCFPSKDVAEMIWYARQDKQWALNKLQGLDKNGNYSPYRQQYKKWIRLYESDIKISPYCCIKQKEEPVAAYEKETGRQPILGLMAEESARRKESWIRTGCNAFHSERPVSKPISFFTAQDNLHYIVKYHLEIAPPYGKICPCSFCAGQMSIFGNVCEMTNVKLRCTRESRTGCMFCLVGAHLDRGAKINRLKKYDERLYDYCMEELGEARVLEWILKNY